MVNTKLACPTLMFCGAFAAAACGDDASPESQICDPAADGIDFGTVGGDEARFAVVRTDYETTAIAILDVSGRVIAPSFFSSGSCPPGLVAPLSGDVVLASGNGREPGVINILDRLGTDVISRIVLTSGGTLGQLRVAPGDFSTNPHDLVVVDENRGWVSRFGVNLDDSAPDANRANDVIEIDPSRLAITGRRVSMSSFDTPVTVMTDDGSVMKTAHARPSRLALVDSTLAVGLSLLTLGFDGAAPGRLGLVDVDSGARTSFDLPPELRNCGSVQNIPGDPDSVLLACSGFSRPFGNEAQIRASAGVYRIRLAGDAPEIVWAWEPRATPSPLAVQNVVAIGPERFLGVAYGTRNVSGDEAFVIDASTGEAISLHRAAEPFALGEAAFDPDTGYLILPDASDGSAGLLLFTGTATTAFEAKGFQTFGDGPLPPRHVRRLAGEASP